MARSNNLIASLYLDEAVQIGVGERLDVVPCAVTEVL